MKKTLSESFVRNTDKALKNEELKEIVGEENFSKFETIVKAAIGVNDSKFLGQIITVLAMGLTIDIVEEIKEQFENPKFQAIILANSLEAFSE